MIYKIFVKFTNHLPGLLALLFSCLPSSSDAQAIKVKVQQTPQGWQLLRNGSPYYVKGAGGETHLDLVAQIGGNSIRTWGAENAQAVLDEAQKNGLTVMLGLWVQHERHGFNYSDPKIVATQLADFKLVIDKFKNHPALLMWGVGNEVDLMYTNPLVWSAIEDIARYAHQVDPNHPTATVTAGLDSMEVAWVKLKAPSIDIYCVNTYGDIADVPENIARYGWTGPYMITEWGPNGHWESPTTKWGAAIEQSSSEKAEVYFNRYEKYIRKDINHCLGSYVFYWGQKQEYTESWYGMFAKDGRKTEAIDALEWSWSKKPLTHYTPSIATLSINGKKANESIYLKSSEACNAFADGKLIQYPPTVEGKGAITGIQNIKGKLNYSWKILAESTDKKSGGDAEKEASEINGLIAKNSGSKPKFFAPAQPGAYRLFVTIEHNNTLAYANIPFFVFVEKANVKNDMGDVNQTTLSIRSLDKAIDEMVDALSLEQKVGQMTQIDLGVIAKGNPCGLVQPQTLDEEKLRIAIEKYHIGSVLNVGCGSGTIALDRWREIHKGIGTAENTWSSTHIPILFGIDAIHGVNYTVGGTLFPQQIGQAATWNRDLLVKAAEITAYECRASGIPWNFSPVLDLGRQPLWSRFFETYGEDVYLAKTLATATINGYQGVNSKDGNIDNQHVAACMKHFLGYSYPLSGKDRTPAWIPERELREYYLPTFESAIEEGALTVMINSGELNGTPVHANPDILTQLLRTELEFKGLAVTDWEDIYKLHTTHKVAASLREAVKLAINAGIDMSMTPNDFQFNELLIDLVKSGEVSESRINEAVHRVLYVKHKLGLLNAFHTETMGVVTAKKLDGLGSPEHLQAALTTAEESITLLKNEKQLLPLNNPNQRILVFGNAADDLNLLNGAWTNTWQGTDSQYAHNQTRGSDGKLLFPTIFEALKETKAYSLTENSSTENRKSVQYLAPISRTPKLYKTLKKSITPNTVGVFCVGETPGTEIPGNINSLEAEIHPNDKAMFDFLVQNNVPVILVLTTGRPRIVTEINNLSTAAIQAYLPGNAGGSAIVNVLFGAVNPSGKLPYTYPKYAGDVVHYDHKSTEKNDKLFGTNAYQPLYDFGHGLSYTQFEYSKMTVKMESTQTLPTESIIPDTSIVKKLQKREQFRLNQMRSSGFNIELTIKNTGTLPGKEVCKLYYRDEFASITPAVKKLCAYHKTRLLQPGESETIVLHVSYHDLSFINKDLQRVIEPGDITFILKDQTATVQIK